MNTKTRLWRSLAALSLAGAITGVGTGVASADKGQRPTTTTLHQELPDDSFPEALCGGEMGLLSLSNGKEIFHITEFEDGRVHVTGTFRGNFSFVQDGITYTGHFTGWFGENVNRNNMVGTFTLSGQGKGSDGSKVSVKGLAHFTQNANGEVTTEFEQLEFTCR